MKRNATYRNLLARRTFLRSSVGAAIALPFLEEMSPRSVWAAPGDVPMRLFTVFFGQGLLPVWFLAGTEGATDGQASKPLLALADVKAKLGLYSGLHQSESGTHAQSGVQCFTGIAGRGSTDAIRASGPSIDQVVLKNAYMNGRAPTPIQTLCAATFFNTRNYSNQRHSWREDGQASVQPYEEVADLFKAVMGLAPGGGPTSPPPVDAHAKKRAAYDKSVLDSVVGEYRRLAGEGGGLGAASRRRIADHLEEIRALEVRILASPGTTPTMTPGGGCKPVSPMTLTRRQVELSGAGSNDRVVDAAKWEQLWQAMADTYVMAVACDLVRFGNVTFQGAGDHLRFDTTWMFRGAPVKFTLGSESNHLSWFHNTSSNDTSLPNVEARKHTAYNLTQVAYFLKKLDGVEAENGRTMLDAAAVLVSTELGEGGGGHSTRSVFHALSSANGRFKTGAQHMFDTHASNFYNAVLKGLGVNVMMGVSKDAAARDAVGAVITA